MDPKRKKILWIGAAIIAAVYYTPRVVMSVRQAAYQRQLATQAALQPKAPTAAPAATAKPAPVPDLASSPGLAGMWRGSAVLLNRGTCMLEIHLQQKQSEYEGRSILTCAPLVTTQPPTNPSYFFMTGKEEKGSVNFRVDKFIGQTANLKSCVITSVSLTPFGQDMMIGQWTDDCQNGQIPLKKVGKA